MIQRRYPLRPLSNNAHARARLFTLRTMLGSNVTFTGTNSRYTTTATCSTHGTPGVVTWAQYLGEAA